MADEIFTDSEGKIIRTSSMKDEHQLVKITEKSPNVQNIGKIVRGDTNSNIITFEINRYYDGVDLYEKNIRLIVKNGNDIFVETAANLQYSDTLLRFSWILSRSVTYKTGSVMAVIEFYSETDSKLDYSLKTIPFKINIEDSLDVSDITGIGEDTSISVSPVPVASVTKADGVSIFTVTDKDGTTSVEILDGQDGTDGTTPHIDSNTKHWFIGETDTGIVAEGIDGITPSIDSSNKHWMFGSVDTGIIAEGVDGVDGSTPTIDPSTKHWFIDGQDTGIIAEGTNGVDGRDGTNGKDGKSISAITKDDNNNLIVTFTDGSTQNIGKLSVDIQSDFLTSEGFGNLRYYNGHFQYYDESSSTWIDTTVTPDNVYVMNMTPKPMKSISVKYNRATKYAEIMFREPDDTYLDGQLFCVIEKVIIVRKKDSEPETVDDGITVLEVTRKNFGMYSTVAYIDKTITPTDGDVYYYKAFPVSTTGFVNNFTENSRKIIIKNHMLYGFKIDQTESDPASMITYLEDCDNAGFSSAYMDYENDIFNYGDWGDSWFIEGLKPCMLKYDGTIDYELDKNDYTKRSNGLVSDIDNTSYNGNAMVGIPKVYWKIVNNGDGTANVYFCDKKISDDFHCWSHIDNNGDEIDYCYIPIYNGSNVNNVIRSISGKYPMSKQTVDTEISYATANNIGTDIIWYTELFCDRMLINLLLMLIGKSTDVQSIFGNGNINTYINGNSLGILNSGTMNDKGLFWGSNGTGSGVKVFGIEHWWGNLSRRIAGYIYDNGVQKIKLTYGTSDGSSVNGYNMTGDGYVSISDSTITGTSGGCISEMIFSELGVLPYKVYGSTSTYYTDLIGFSNSQVNYAVAYSDTAIGTKNGAFCFTLNTTASYYDYFIGTSISCKPLAAT